MPKPQRAAKRRKERANTWLEEFKCGCTNAVATKREAVGYCPKHGEDRLRMTLLPGSLTLGLAT